MKRKQFFRRTACLVFLLLLLFALLCACSTAPLPSSSTQTPTTLPSGDTTSGATTLPSTEPPLTEPEQKIADLLSDFSPTGSVTLITTRTGSQPELTQTETIIMTEGDGGRLFRRTRTTQKLLPIVIDENHNVVSGGGLSEESDVVYLYEGQAGACFPVVGTVLSPEEYSSLSFKENSDGSSTLTCAISAKNPPAWLGDLYAGSLINGTLSVTADIENGRILEVSVFLYAWGNSGAEHTRITITYDYTPHHFSLPD